MIDVFLHNLLLVFLPITFILIVMLLIMAVGLILFGANDEN